MGKKVVYIICMLMISICINVFFVEKTNAAGTTIYVDYSGGQDYTSIQDAIDNATTGDTIYVYSGTYYESITIDIQLTLTGQNIDTTIIDGESSDDNLIYVTADYVQISDFTIQNSNYKGIVFDGSSNSEICQNNIDDNNEMAIWLKANSDDNTISSNTISGGNYGIYIQDSSSGNIIVNNDIENAITAGIHIWNSNDNTIYHNNFINSEHSIDEGSNNWDNGYPSGGNYWSDESCTDIRCGPNQDIYGGGDGICDGHNQIYGMNADHYPWVNQNGWNGLPTAEANGPYSGSEGESILFDGSGSSDDGSIVSYRWDWSYTGSSDWDWDTDWLSSPTTSHSYSTAGTYTVMLQVKDDDGFVNADATTAIISEAENQAPTANAGGPYSGYIDVSLQLYGSGSTDSDGSIVGYRWDFENDGAWDTDWLTSSTTTHTYTSIGSYTVKLQIKDNDDAIDNDTATVTITEYNYPPIADSGGEYKVNILGQVTLDGSGSYDTDGTIEEYRWIFLMFSTDWSTSPTYVFTPEPYISTYSSGLQQRLVLQVKDDQGIISEDATGISYYILSADPGGPYSGYVNNSITFDASESEEDGMINSYSWDFGDGDTVNGKTTTHKYINNGTYTVTLTIEDDGGLTDIATTTATITELPINEIPPNADANGPYAANVNDTVTFDASNSNDNDGTIINYNWSFGDGTYGEGISPIHIYSSKGNYTIKLTVEDNDGLIDTDYTIARISQPPVETDNYDTNDTINDNTQTDENTPGFEIILVISAIALVLIINRKREKI